MKNLVFITAAKCEMLRSAQHDISALSRIATQSRRGEEGIPFRLTIPSSLPYSAVTMIRAGAGQSSRTSTKDAVAEAGAQALAEAGISRADTAVAFFTAEHAGRSNELAESLSAATGAETASVAAIAAPIPMGMRFIQR